MAREVYRWNHELGRGEWLEVIDLPPQPRVFIIGDAMPMMRNHAVRKDHPDAYLESKSRYEQSLAANNCAVLPENHSFKQQTRPTKVNVKEAVERASRSLTYKNDQVKDID